MTYKLFRILLAVACVMALCGQALASPAEVINDFAFSAAKILGSNSGSWFFSPFSIISAFGMAYAGAAGTTAREMEQALGFTKELHGELGNFVQDIAGTGQVSSANRVWLNTGLTLRKDYQENLYMYYRSKAAVLDMTAKNEESRKAVNDWVSEKTNGKIPELLATLDPETRMIITNAVYFNAEWQYKFSKKATTQEKFTDGEKVSEVPMMKINRNYSYGEFDGVKVVQIPYKERRLFMIAVLPPEDNAHALDSLDTTTLTRWLSELETYKVDLWLPKFRTEKSYELGDMFKALGVRLAFSDAADFSGMTDSEQLKIDAVIHKTFIDVDEEKTEAAAATAIMMMRATAMRPDIIKRAEFHADRPFTYFILDNATGTILFMGRQTF